MDVKDALNGYIDDYIYGSFGIPKENEKALNLRMRLKEDYAKFMLESNNTYIYQVNDNYDLVVEISNLIDQ